MRAVDTRTTIEPGDFIKAAHTTCTGFALRRYHHALFDGWVIETARGTEDVIDDAAAELIHKSDAWWERYAAELPAVD